MRSCFGLIILSSLLATSPALGFECSPEQQRQIQTISADISQKLVSEDFLGGRDVQYEIDACAFDPEQDAFDIDLRVKWRGAILRRNEYEIWGRLLTNFDGSESTFFPTGANDKVQSLRFWGNISSIGISIVRN